MKHILISNDDGYASKGLLKLVAVLQDLAHITVVAPSTEKSACGHSLTLHHPLSFIGVDDDFYKLDDGTPSDCIYLALHSLFENQRPDLIISGINHGSNMGEDITYSGTAAAAMEGVIHGVPSIAVSQVMDYSQPIPDFELAGKAIRMLVQQVFRDGFPLPPRQFLNVNIPYGVDEAEIVTTYAGYRLYGNDAHLHRNPRGLEYYWLGLHPLEFRTREGQEGLCDFEAIEQQKISMSPIQVDMSAYASLQSLEAWL
ncbi:MAG: 5'/3'-nucleotidase SurE [Sulfurimonas sp.]|nr:MAG: 5'/3'-nucleotidase SurE [Sulfurimonas sp.]